MKISEISAVIESVAPLAWQESYDNSGLIVGRPDDEVHCALLAVDVTDEVMDEAEREGCDLIITHHPVIFHPLKRLNSADMTQRCVERAIRRGIAIYACHTNLDAAPDGMSFRLASMLGVGSLRLLQPAGDSGAGFGVAGELPEEIPFARFMERIRSVTGAPVLRHSTVARPTVRRVAVCTGAGAFLTAEAGRAGVDVYVTSDLKYNDFTAPDGRFTIVDAGHFESEYCAIEILFDILSKKLCTFAVRRSECSRNPVNYFM